MEFVFSAMCGDRSLVRRGTGPKGHWSESYIVVRSGGGANPTLHTIPHPFPSHLKRQYRSGVRRPTLDSCSVRGA